LGEGGMAECIESWPDLPPEIQDRNADIWEPLIAIADEIGGVGRRRQRRRLLFL
jgi:hypothetical protein